MSTTHERWRLHSSHSEARVGGPCDVDVIISTPALTQFRSTVRSAKLREIGGVARLGEQSDGLMVIDEVISSRESDRGPNHFLHDAAEVLRQADEGPIVLWHSHIVGDGDQVSATAPSSSDLAVWSRYRRALDYERLLGLIVYRFSATEIAFDAFVISEGTGGRDIARSARSRRGGSVSDKQITPSHLLNGAVWHISHVARHAERLLSDPEADLEFNATHIATHTLHAADHIARLQDFLSENPSDPSIFKAETAKLRSPRTTQTTAPKLPTTPAHGRAEAVGVLPRNANRRSWIPPCCEGYGRLGMESLRGERALPIRG